MTSNVRSREKSLPKDAGMPATLLAQFLGVGPFLTSSIDEYGGDFIDMITDQFIDLMLMLFVWPIEFGSYLQLASLSNS